MEKPNILDLGLSKEEHELVQRGAVLYKQTHLKAFDSVFEIARAIDVLQKRNWGSGVQGSFAAALLQYGFTTRDGMKPIDTSIRNAYADLLANEEAVRNWWDTEVKNPKKDLWLSARAIHRNWRYFVDPESRPKRQPTKKWGRIIEGKALTEEEIRQRSSIKPSPEQMQAKAAAAAEAERQKLDAEEDDLSTELRKFENENADLKATIKELEEKVAAGTPRPTLTDDVTAVCGFCGKTNEQVETMVAGGVKFGETSLCICNECIPIVSKIAKESKAKKAKPPAAESPKPKRGRGKRAKR